MCAIYYNLCVSRPGNNVSPDEKITSFKNRKNNSQSIIDFENT